MKTRLLFSTLAVLFVFTISSFSQTVYKVDKMRIYYWDDISMPENWSQYSTETYTYGNGGNKETHIIAKSYPASMNQYQHTKTYNGNNDIITSTRQDWNGVAWENDSKDTHTYYTGTSNVKDITSYSYSQGNDSFKALYNNYSGTDFSEIIFKYGGSGGLVNAERFEYTYNSPGKPATETESKWVGGAWQLYEKSFATYSSDQRIVDVYKYNGGILATEPFDRYITNYSGALETEYIWQSWDGANWENNDIEISEYDANGNKKVYTLAEWDSGDWAPYYKEERDYTVAAPLSIEAFQNKHLKIFPNPASDIIHISTFTTINKIEMFDVLGKNVLTTFGTKQIDVKNYKSGIYVLKIYTDNLTTSKKIVIK